MKTKINKNGRLEIKAKNEREDMLLHSWYLVNKTKVINQEIIFVRFLSK